MSISVTNGRGRCSRIVDVIFNTVVISKFDFPLGNNLKHAARRFG
jgi:hypothetical protein